MVHVSERGLVELIKQSFLWNKKLNKLESCHKIILGKNRVKFENCVHNSIIPFRYVHLDLWGPIRVETHGVDFISSILLMISLEEFMSTF